MRPDVIKFCNADFLSNSCMLINVNQLQMTKFVYTQLVKRKEQDDNGKMVTKH